MILPFAPLTNAQLQTSCTPTGGAPTGNWTAATCASNTSGNVASVRVSATFAPITPVFSDFVIPMSASAAMVIN